MAKKTMKLKLQTELIGESHKFSYSIQSIPTKFKLLEYTT